jgi:hypothetical protein
MSYWMTISGRTMKRMRSFLERRQILANHVGRGIECSGRRNLGEFRGGLL